MTPYRLILLLSVFAFTAGVFAQGSRTNPVTEGKANQRAVQPTPTPAPRPLLDDDGEVIRVSTQLVSVPVRVMDKSGRFIAALGKRDFKVFENEAEQEIAHFSNEHQPFTVALVLDMSYSTTFKIGEIQNAAIAFIDQLRPQERVMVVAFDQDIHVLCEPTADRKEIYRAIKTTRISTGTSLYEAVDLVINRILNKQQGRKAIILFSDGVDTTSRRADDRNNLSDALESDSLIYTIRYDTFADVQEMKNGKLATRPRPIIVPTHQDGPLPFPIPPGGIGTPSSIGTTPAEYEKAAEFLNKLAENTGGRLYEASTLTNLADAYTRIAGELREFYSISYYPAQERGDGSLNVRVQVKVSKPGMVVRSRETFLKRRSVTR